MDKVLLLLTSLCFLALFILTYTHPDIFDISDTRYGFGFGAFVMWICSCGRNEHCKPPNIKLN